MKLHLLTILALMGASSASAATCNKVNFSATQNGSNLIGECFSGNDTNTITSTFKLFDETGWLLSDKTDSAKLGPVDIATFTSGVWKLATDYKVSDIVLTIKQGNAFAAFKLNALDILSGTWYTGGPGESVMDFSHASVYYKTPAPIPLPASAALMLLALATLIPFMRKSS